MLSHDVYFTLHDASPDAVAKLTEACHASLDSHPGIVFFAVGTRNTALTRDVNDVEFHVALHIVFVDEATHDAYQAAPAHHAFIERNRSNWATVRVFDSTVTGGVRSA